jgi:hypothetical protein
MVFTGQDDKTFFYNIINQPVAGMVKRIVLQCINGVSSNPVEGRTKI